jgi:hypothetical protein
VFSLTLAGHRQTSPRAEGPFQGTQPARASGHWVTSPCRPTSVIAYPVARVPPSGAASTPVARGHRSLTAGRRIDNIKSTPGSNPSMVRTTDGPRESSPCAATHTGMNLANSSPRPVRTRSAAHGSGNQCVNQCTRSWIAAERARVPQPGSRSLAVWLLLATRGNERLKGSPVSLVAVSLPRPGIRGTSLEEASGSSGAALGRCAQEESGHSDKSRRYLNRFR